MQRPSEEANSATFEHRTHSAWAPPSFLVSGPVRKVSVRLCWGLGTGRGGRAPGNNLAPIGHFHGVGVFSDEYHWAKNDSRSFHTPESPGIYPTYFTLIPRNLGLPCWLLSTRTTWKFGELFYSRSKNLQTIQANYSNIQVNINHVWVRTLISWTDSWVDLYPRTLLLQSANKKSPLNDLVSSGFRRKGTRHSCATLRAISCLMASIFRKRSGHNDLACPGTEFFSIARGAHKKWDVSRIVARAAYMKDL